MKKITITDIANRLGVSKTTVSFVLNNKGDERNIATETREKIFDLVKELNYHPSILAQSLKMGKTFAIAYLVPDISNPFYASIGRKIEDLLLKKGYHLFISSTDENPDKEGSQIQTLLSRQVDGMIIASSNIPNSDIFSMIEQNYPLVLFDRFSEDIDANYVLVENENSMKKAVEVLINQNCKKIGLLSITPDIISLKQRIEGYKKAVSGIGMQDPQKFIRTVDKENIKESTLKEMQYLISKGVDAMVFTNNLVAQEAIWHINVHFKEHIDKIKFACFDDIKLFDYSMPRVLSLAQPIEEIANSIVSLLEKQLNGESSKEKIILDPKMINRN